MQSEGTPIEQSIPSPAQQVVVTEAADCAIEAGLQPPPRPPRPPCRQGGIIAQSGSSQSELPSPSLSWRSKHSAPLSVLGSSVSQPGLRAHGRRVSAVRARPGVGTRAYRLRGVGGEFPRRERKRTATRSVVTKHGSERGGGQRQTHPPRPPRPPAMHGGAVAQSGSSQSAVPSPSLSWPSPHSRIVSVFGSSVLHPPFSVCQPSRDGGRADAHRPPQLRGNGAIPEGERRGASEGGANGERPGPWGAPAAAAAPAARHARRRRGAVGVVAVGRAIAVIVLAVAALAHRLGVRVVAPAPTAGRHLDRKRQQHDGAQQHLAVGTIAPVADAAARGLARAGEGRARLPLASRGRPCYWRCFTAVLREPLHPGGGVADRRDDPQVRATDQALGAAAHGMQHAGASSETLPKPEYPLNLLPYSTTTPIL